jgi:hypothetical protein
VRLPASLSRKTALLGSGMVVVLLAVAGIALSAGSAPPTGAATTGSGAFSITGTTDTMRPGVATTLTLTVSNPQSTMLFLSSVSASVASAVYPNGTPAPAVCAGYLSPALPHTWTSWTGPTTVPAAADGSHPGTATLTVALSFTDSGTNQDVCKDVKFNLTFAGSAYYTDPTTTALTTSPNPANVGAPVTLTATVTSTYSGANPVGTVSFTTPSGPIVGSPVTLTPVSASNKSVATLTTSSLPAGTTQITATYNAPSSGSNGGPDFSGSSGTAGETVVAGCVVGPTTGATTVIGPGTTYNGNYTVTSGKSLWLNGGTINGNVTVDPGGQLTATGGAIKGHLKVNGASAIRGTTISGNVQSSNAGLSLGYGTSVNGNVQSDGSGQVCINGVTVNGNVQLQKLTGSSTASVCETTASGNLLVQDNVGPVLIGGSSTCAGNTIDGNIQVQKNTAGGKLVGNKSGGNCQLQNNTPGIAGSANTAKGNNSCNGTA